MSDEKLGLPQGDPDERELLLSWLRYLRGAIERNVEGVDEEQARWTPNGQLIPLIGVMNHLTHVEWRWIDGGFCGAAITRQEQEFRPSPETTLADVRLRYRERAALTETVVRSLPLDTPHADGTGRDLRWVLLHLMNETARHAGHADAVRELMDGTTGE